MKRNRRLIILFGFFGVWLAVALSRSVHFAVEGVIKKALEIEAQFAVQEGALAPPRGRIVDCNNVPLAWTERYFDLYWIAGDGEEADPEEWNLLREILPEVQLPEIHGAEARQLLRRRLAVSEVLKLETLVKNSGHLKIVSRLERIAVNSTALRRILGEVEECGGVLCGISGIEEKYDTRLRGKPGRFRVLLDRYHNWIERSWELVEEPIPGEDVKLAESIAELEKSAGENR